MRTLTCILVSLALVVYFLFVPPSARTQDLAIDDGSNQLEATATPGPAPDNSNKETAKQLGLGMGSVLASIVYSPLKVTYAGLGLLTGGIGYVVSGGRTDVAKSIINPAVRGNYIITPSNLQGKERVIFVGPPPTQEAPPPPLASASPASPN